MNNIADIILEASYQITADALTRYMHDTTAVCTIIDNSRAKIDNTYRVTYNNLASYDVYGENQSYIEGEQVVVLFPADSNQRKVILSRYSVPEDGGQMAYVQGEDKFARMSQGVTIEGSGTINLKDKGIYTSQYDSIYIKGKFKYAPTEENRSPYQVKLKFSSVVV